MFFICWCSKGMSGHQSHCSNDKSPCSLKSLWLHSSRVKWHLYQVLSGTWCQESEHFPGQILRYSRSGRSFRIFISDQLQVMSVWLQEESKSMEPRYRCFQCLGDLGEQSHPEIQNWCLPAFEQRICTCDSDGTDWYAATLKNTTAAKYNQYNDATDFHSLFFTVK